MRPEAGARRPLGVHVEPDGTNFALYSEHATAVTLCLLSNDALTEIPLFGPMQHVFCGRVPRVPSGTLYAFRVNGPRDLGRGHRFESGNVLLDPYARRVVQRDGAFWGVLADDTFSWGGDRSPQVPWSDTILYEAHVKGLTARHPDVPTALRGTYLGLTHESVLEHLRRLGITSLELLPVFVHADEPKLVAKGLTNYWGYNPVALFAPTPRYATRGGDEVFEFRTMVQRLHVAGFEVILDVVYNHTGEGDETGPCVSFRGIDNRTYYHTDPENRERYVDYTGCGNSVRANHPEVLKLILESLRYWVTEMHVDGFRFDLAAALMRTDRGLDPQSAFFAALHQDPVLSRVKLIAEPWDLGADGYQSGKFPLFFAEWNGRFRDTVRRFWKGEKYAMADLGYRLSGSSDLFGDDGRGPSASINFVTAHDGFTLRDLVSYETKHNELNGENNADGITEAFSQNFGVEGETSDETIQMARVRQMKNLLATLLLSQGVPMLSMGDELGRTQRGNSNAYCQDNETSYVDWRPDPPFASLVPFVSELLRLRRACPLFRRETFFRGAIGEGLHDIEWRRPDGGLMLGEDWRHPKQAALMVRLVGGVPDGSRILEGPDVFLLLNAEAEAVRFALPEGIAFSCVLRTDAVPAEVTPCERGEVSLLPRTVWVLRGVRNGNVYGP